MTAQHAFTVLGGASLARKPVRSEKAARSMARLQRSLLAAFSRRDQPGTGLKKCEDLLFHILCYYIFRIAIGTCYPLNVKFCLRFFACRKNYVKTKHFNPSKKLRHPKLDYQELVKQSEEQYVDFQQAGMATALTKSFACPHAP